MAISYYGKQSDIETRSIGSLALIAPLIDRMDVAGIVNRHLPTDPQAEFDLGTIISLLVAARLYSPVALSNVGQWAHDSGAEHLWGIPQEKLNDDRLGRALDKFFQQRHSILASLALKVAKEFDVPLREVHYDPTHILFEGAYENAKPRNEVVERSDEDEIVRSDARQEPAHITKGRATDDAPKGAMMIHVGICTHVDEFGPLPFFGHTIDGNQNGRKAVDEQLALFRKHLKPQKLTSVSDRGTFSVGHLARLQKENFHAICAVPWGEFKELFDEKYNSLVWNQASYLSTEQRRRREQNSALPQEHYELAVINHCMVSEAKEKIPCRVIFVFSTADQKVVRKQRDKQIAKIREGLEKTQRNVARRGPHSDEASVIKRVNRILGTKDASKYFSFEMIPLSKSEQKTERIPGAGNREPTHRFEFTYNEQAVKDAEEYDGYSVMVTTVPKTEHSADTIFTKYKEQIYSEQINRTLKGPNAVRPVFLHTPERVESLVFVMLIVLMLYYLLQREYRKTIPEDASPKEQRTTTLTIFKAFTSYSLLLRKTKHGTEIQPSKLTPRQREILRRLQFKTPAQLLSQRLPRPPT